MGVFFAYFLAPFAFIPLSHSAVRSSPTCTRRDVTNAWKDAFVGAQPTLPFHIGCVKSKMLSGSSSILTRSGEYASVRALPLVATQKPSASRNPEGTCVSMDSGNFSNIAFLLMAPSAPASCAQKSAAGLLSPSVRIAAASWVVPP